MYEKNLVNFKELTMYILAGYKRLEEIKKNDLPAALKKADIALNRKMLSEIAIADPEAFTALVEKAKAAL